MENEYLVKGSEASSCILIGFEATSEYSDCIVIGDNCSSEAEGDVVVGETMLNKPIPASLRQYIYNYPEDFRMFLETLVIPFKMFAG